MPDNLNVLVVEDNPINQKVIKKLLEKKELHVHLANNGQEGFDSFVDWAYQGQFFKIIFMDLQMPVLDGYSATKRIRETEINHHLKRTPVIAVTAHALPSDHQLCMAIGMDGFVTKPIDPDVLYSVIDKVCCELHN